MIADLAAALDDAVVIDRHRAAAEIHLASHITVADIGQMRYGRAFADVGILDLDKIPDPHALPDAAVRTDMHKRPDPYILLDHRLVRLHIIQTRTVLDRAGFHQAVRADRAALTDHGFSTDDRPRQDPRPCTDRHIRRDYHPVRALKDHPVVQMPADLLHPGVLVEPEQIPLAVRTKHHIRILRQIRPRTQSLRQQQRHRIRQIILPGRILTPDLPEYIEQIPRAEPVCARIDLADCLLLFVGILLLHNGTQTLAVPDNAPVSRGIRKPCRDDRHGIALRFVHLPCRTDRVRIQEGRIPAQHQHTALPLLREEIRCLHHGMTRATLLGLEHGRIPPVQIGVDLLAAVALDNAQPFESCRFTAPDHPFEHGDPQHLK